MKLFPTVGANDNVYVEAVLKKETGFDTSEYRVGFKFGEITLEVVSRNGMFFSVYTPDWSDYKTNSFASSTFSAYNFKEAFEGNGLKIRAARINDIYYMYVIDNCEMIEV